MKIIVNNVIDSTLTVPVAAAQPIIGGNAPAAPPITIFWGVRRFSQIV